MNPTIHERVTAHLRDLISAGKGDRLPTVRTLCAQLGVSSGTICRSLDVLRTEGLVRVRRGDGIRPLGSVPSQVEPVGQRITRMEVSRLLTKDLEAGRWSSGQRIDPPKELAHRLKVHPATVRMALRALVEVGVLVREGRGHRVPLPGRVPGSGVLRCVGQGDGRGGLRMDTDRELAMWRDVQTEASRMGLIPRVVAWDGSCIPRQADEVGAVVSLWHVEDPHELLRSVVSTKLRAAVWNEHVEVFPGARWTGHPQLLFHDLGQSRLAGRAMGQHVVEMGFRRVTWISPFHGSLWSVHRMEGLAEVLPDGVTPFVLPFRSMWDWFEPALARRSGEGEKRELWSLHPAGPIDATIEEDAWKALFVDLDRLWSGALAEGVWVCANDQVAVIARRWLEHRGIPVPGRVAVAGFDDSDLALREDLTSVRFDTTAMARSMLRFVVDPSVRGGRLLHHPCTVVRRGSVSRATTHGIGRPGF